MPANIFRLEDAVFQTSYFQLYLEQLLSLLQSTYYGLNLIVKVLISGPDGSGKRLLAKAAAQKLNMKFCEERVANLFDENIIGTEKKVKSAINKLAESSPCLMYLSGYELFLHLEDEDVDRIQHCLRESIDDLIDSQISKPIVLVVATNDHDRIYRSVLSSLFQHSIQIKSPNLAQADEVVNSILREANIELAQTNLVSSSCANGEYYLGNLVSICSKEELKISTEDNTTSDDSSRTKEDKGTRWLDIGGLNDIKREIIDAVQLSLDYPQLKKSGLRRTGILLFGPPGTGKTLLAKAVATECSLSFINVKGPELLNEYVGQSEDNIRKLFQRARDSSPAVIFFDELDSLAPNRGQAGDSGGVMDRIVSQILSEMDGVGKSESVFIIGATNRVDLVDPSLLRPGRFDKVLEVPLPVSRESRLQILRAITRKMELSHDVDLERLESMAPANMSGAEFQGLCSKAQHRAFDRCIQQVELGLISELDANIVTTMDDFLSSLNPV